MFIAFGAAGLLAISYAVWVRNERVQNVWFIVGGSCLLVYSASIGDIIFIVLQIVFIASALVELVKLQKKKSKQFINPTRS